MQSDSDKAWRAKHKEEMIQEFWDELHLTVCQIREKSGTSNTGPTVKDAFRHPETLAKIVHCDENLIQGLKVLFEVMDSCKIINAERFRQFCEKWLDDHSNSNVAWNRLSPTLHFIFHHGHEVHEA